jgi:hypothetical protein
MAPSTAVDQSGPATGPNLQQLARFFSAVIAGTDSQETDLYTWLISIREEIQALVTGGPVAPYGLDRLQDGLEIATPYIQLFVTDPTAEDLAEAQEAQEVLTQIADDLAGRAASISPEIATLVAGLAHGQLPQSGVDMVKLLALVMNPRWHEQCVWQDRQPVLRA